MLWNTYLMSIILDFEKHFPLCVVFLITTCPTGNLLDEKQSIGPSSLYIGPVDWEHIDWFVDL